MKPDPAALPSTYIQPGWLIPPFPIPDYKLTVLKPNDR